MLVGWSCGQIRKQRGRYQGWINSKSIVLYGAPMLATHMAPSHSVPYSPRCVLYAGTGEASCSPAGPGGPKPKAVCAPSQQASVSSNTLQHLVKLHFYVNIPWFSLRLCAYLSLSRHGAPTQRISGIAGKLLPLLALLPPTFRSLRLQTSLTPAQAVNVLNDRVRHIGHLNNQIADWLQVQCVS